MATKPAQTSIYVVSAICGNFWRESTMSPNIWEGLKVGTWTDLQRGYGLGQWTNVMGDTHSNLYQLHSWMTSNGYSMDDPYGQMEFLLYENHWFSVGEASIFPNLQAFLESDSTDLQVLTLAFTRGWEGITDFDGSYAIRVGYANQVYNYLLAHSSDSVAEWVKGNRYLSQAEVLSNCVLLYQYFNGFNPPTPPTPTKKRRMPIWMMLRPRYLM